MKNKKFTYLLGGAVMIVWGLIIYRVFGALGDNGPDAAIMSGPVKKEAYNDYSIPEDTTRLLLNYRDPFGIVQRKDTASRKPAPPGMAQIAPHQRLAAMNWDFIRYVGYIRNADSRKLVAIVHLNGTELMMSEGEMNSGLKLIRNYQDSIKIAYQGETKYIPLKPATP
ncbi:hypothetical protein [Mucilaginibacter rubeus]|uniref:Type II secretion system protein GspC N-terminal domain-containing protein n=1 Tax=Mucilaginibacter rubeus TaxID=2027860 RepID=A0A5C1HU43_9SPHI|nr:hypothetical protein [Mucilaginibacter rubeus]QEM09155.1 hypothetical protein DEO27_003690 [Mucilaginibacter rubeus]